MFAEIVEAWPSILLAYATLGVVALAPGPTAMAIMGISMSQGRKAGFLFTAGCMSGAASWALMAGLGLSAWLTSYAQGVAILKFIGGVYLLWMAYKALRSAMSATNKLDQSAIVKNTINLYRRGLLLHLTNPKAILGWAAVITISQGESASIPVLVVTLLGCLIITNIIHFTYASMFASKAAMATYRKARRWIEGTLAAVFGYAGFRLMIS
jgi:threonine/homoserine/homoserine lactone efflux protein